jgi:phosphatidylglycerophosphate synthase
MYRTMAARQGISVPASSLAKWKTFTQQFAVGLVLLPPLGRRITWPAVTTLWFATVLTLVTGAQYLLSARQRAVAQRVI